MGVASIKLISKIRLHQIQSSDVSRGKLPPFTYVSECADIGLTQHTQNHIRLFHDKCNCRLVLHCVMIMDDNSVDAPLSANENAGQSE